MDQLIGVTDCYLFQGVANVLVFQRVVGPRVFGLVPDEAAIAAVLPRAQIVLAELARALGTGPYLVGADLTLADLHLAPQLDLFALTPEWESLTAPHPELRAWLTRLLARPSLQATTWERVAARARAA